MPELAEVEFGRSVAERVGAGRVVERVWCDDDPIVFHGVTPATVTRRLRGRRIEQVHRRGKYIWFELDERPWPIFHFGMTGAFLTPGETPLTLESGPREPRAEWPPRFAKIRLWLDDGGELVMTNARRLGRIRLCDDPVSTPPIADLGFDPLLDLPRPAAFRRLLADRGRAVLKGLLLDQGFAAGVGNWLADEALFQAGIDPRRRAASLSEAEAEALRRAIGRVVRRAVKVDACAERFPRDWLFHRRWGKNKDATLRDGTPISFTTVAGRTTAWVPQRQR